MEEMLQLQGKIQSLDPLGADAIFAHLPTYNTMRNVQGLIDVTRSVLPWKRLCILIRKKRMPR
jgi:hypothetical protein